MINILQSYLIVDLCISSVNWCVWNNPVEGKEINRKKNYLAPQE